MFNTLSSVSTTAGAVAVIIIIEIGVALCSSSSSSCPNSLHFIERVYFDETQTFSLRICCNITRLWMGRVSNDWTVTPVAGLQWLPIENLTMPGFDLLVSRCRNDKPYVLGELVGRGCHSQRGHIVTLTKSPDRLPEFDQWYITCFEMISSDKQCKICKLEMYCTHQRRCKEKFLHREIVNASLTTMTIVVNVGNLPFDNADILTEIIQTTTLPNNHHQHDSNNNKTSSLSSAGPLTHYSNTAQAARNRSMKYEVEGLKLNTWYQILTCVIVRPPSSFRLVYPNITLPNEEKFCLDIEGYRTSRPRTSSSAQLVCTHCPSSVSILRVCFFQHIILIVVSLFYIHL